MFNINKLITRIRDNERTPPSSPSGKQNSSNSADVGVDGAAADKDETEAEGFLCPSCMEGFPSPEELSEHYESHHAADVGLLHVCPVCKTKFPTVDQLQLHYAADHPPVSRTMIVAPSNELDIRSLRQEVVELQTTLREERWYSDELKREVGRLTDNINRGEEPEENALMKHQLKALEESRTLLSSEVVLLRNQLADAVDTNTSLKQQKEILEPKAASMAGERASLLATIDEERSGRARLENRLCEMENLNKNLEVQLQQRPETDDIRVLRHELVQVQTSMDKLRRESEQERDRLLDENTKLMARSRELGESIEEDQLKFTDEVQKLLENLKEKTKKLEEAELAATITNEQMTNMKVECGASKEECQKIKAQFQELEETLHSSKAQLNAEKASFKEHQQMSTFELNQRDELIKDLKRSLDDITLQVQEKETQIGISRKQLSTLKSHFQAQSGAVDDVKIQLRELKLELENEQRNRRNEEEKTKDLELEIVRKSEAVAVLEGERLELYAKIVDGEGANAAMQQLRQKEMILTEDLINSQKTVTQQAEEMAKLNDKLHHSLQDFKLKSETDREKVVKLEADLATTNEQLIIHEERCHQLEENMKSKSDAYVSSEARWKEQRLELERSLQMSKCDLEAKQAELEVCKDKLSRTSEEMIMAKESCKALESTLKNEKQTVAQIRANLDSNKAKTDQQKLQLVEKDKEIDKLEKCQHQTNCTIVDLKKMESELSNKITDLESNGISKDTRITALDAMNEDFRLKNIELQQQLDDLSNILTDTISELLSGYREEQSRLNLSLNSPFEKQIKNLDQALIEARNSMQIKEDQERHLQSRVSDQESKLAGYKLEIAELHVILDDKKSKLSEKDSQLLDLQYCSKQQEAKLSELYLVQKHKGELEESVATLRKELDASNQSLQLNTLQRTSLETELFDAQNSLADMEENNTRLQQKIKELDERIVLEIEDKTRIAVSHEESQKAAETEIERLEERMTDITSQLADTLSSKFLLTQEMEQLKCLYEEQASTLSDKLSVLRSEFNSKQDECAELENKVDRLSGDKLELEAKLENLVDERRALLERCLSCEAECEKLRTLTVEIRRRLDDAQSALHELGRENQTLQLETAKHVNRKWANDSEVVSCTLCQKAFSVTNRKHHCRNCGNIFCNECSARNATVPAHKKPVRVCDTCYGELGNK